MGLKIQDAEVGCDAFDAFKHDTKDFFDQGTLDDDGRQRELLVSVATLDIAL
jgi:hypothetical protein